MSGWQPYPYQLRVSQYLLKGQSVILQAPTGAGKTTAALLPFLHARRHLPSEAFPKKCIYSVPMRVLANQFHDEYKKLIRRYGWEHTLDVSIQTGAHAEDMKVEGDLIFTTIDQTLSNFLNIPYALSLSQGNLNAGAIVSSYLVFDELHLFDPETTLPTTLHLLRLLKGVVPFLVMTATFSTERLKALAKELGAEVVLLSADEAGAIPSQQKTRCFHTVDDTLTAYAVWERHQRRSVAICNTVDRAQMLFDGIRQLAGPNVDVRLLHSRFLRADREATEAWLQREFGKDRSQHAVENAILIATQVVEVGLDISSQALHTELAPAASIIQRAGRCARYQSETGDVYIYRLPTDDKGHPKYAPYQDGGQGEICELTWEALQTNAGLPCNFERELAIVDHAHQAADLKMIEKLRANRHTVADLIAKTIAAQERGSASELIRGVDSRTVIAHPQPTDIENPWAFEGFSIFRGSLFGCYKDLAALADQQGADWVMMTADALPEDEESQQSRTVWRWRYIGSVKELEGALLVAVNPLLAHYSSERGFQLGVLGDPNWQSPPATKGKMRQTYPPYQRETMAEHIARMTRVYRYPFFDQQTGKQRPALAEELAHAARRLEERMGWLPGTLDRLARVAIVAHDLGKLDVRWQSWAHRWQREVSQLRGVDATIPDDYLAAHTDYDGQNPAEKALNQKLNKLRPNHAAESAAAAANWLMNETGNQALARAVLTALISHHSAGSSGKHEAFQAHPAAATTFKQMLAEAGLEEGTIQRPMWKLPAGEELINRKMRPDRDDEVLAYLLVVRALRLADQRSQSWQ